MNKDIFNAVKKEQILDPAVATATVTSSACDLQNYESADFSVSFGESGDTLSGTVKWDCKLTECDTEGGSYTDVAAADIIGASSNAFGLVDAAADDDEIYTLGYKGTKQFIKVVVTGTGTHTNGTIIGIYASKGHKRESSVGNLVTPA